MRKATAWARGSTLLGERGEVGADDLHFVEDAVGVIQQLLAYGREFYAVAQAVEETEWEVILEGLDCMTDRRLG